MSLNTYSTLPLKKAALDEPSQIIQAFNFDLIHVLYPFWAQ